MPIDSEINARMAPLQGYTLEEEWDAEMLARWEAYCAPIGDYRAPETDVGEHMVAGPHGEIPVRIYRPLNGATSGIGVVWLHGGAFVAGDLDMPEADTVARELCARTDATVVSVDYRLAGDGVYFPVPHDDVVAAWCWTAEASAQLNIDPSRLALGGASAGGNLAAGAALALRDQGSQLPSRLLLAYPAMHHELPPTDHLPFDIALIASILRFGPEVVAGMSRDYIGDGATPTPYAFPSLGDLERLPATAILTCEYDDLRISGEAFADKLRAAGVPVVLRREAGVPHGHLNIPGLAAAEPSLGFLATALTSATSSL